MSETEEHEHSPHPAFVIVTCCIFALVSFTFLFPCNRLIPLDRRTVAAVGALLCYLTSTFLFPSHRIDLLHAVDFDVLILLASIMLINHIVVHLKETKRLIDWFQALVKENPTRGFWIISFTAFIVSPFLTNDGVCLLFVEPILRVFEEVGHAADIPVGMQLEDFPLTRSDAIYFLLTLACSTNIGSSLTYTGNPQNMIVASAAIGVMPSYKFLVYMSLPATVAWLVTTKWIEWCWMSSRARAQVPSAPPPLPASDHEAPPQGESSKLSLSLVSCGDMSSASSNSQQALLSPRRERARARERLVRRAARMVASPLPYAVLVIFFAMIVMIFIDVMPISGLICAIAIAMVLTVVLGNYWKNEVVWQEHPDDHHQHATAPPAPAPGPVPQPALPAPLPQGERLRSSSRSSRASGGGHSRHSSRTSNNGGIAYEEVQQPMDIEMMLTKMEQQQQPVDHLSVDTMDLPYTAEDRIDNLNDFFDDLFKSVDYSLLLIFLGTFIVIESMASTGLPKGIWSAMVGKTPFRSISSVVGISAFVLIASQLLGNVAVVQLAKPNVQDLGEADRRFAWCIIAFISTIGGNLTITGSAANIIVAEKANRMDATIALDFFKHYRVCCWITLLCCLLCGCILSFIVLTDNANGSAW